MNIMASQTTGHSTVCITGTWNEISKLYITGPLWGEDKWKSIRILSTFFDEKSLQWRYNQRHGVSNNQPHDCLLNRSFRRRSKKTSKLHVTDLCAGNSSVTGEFPALRACNAENVSIWWRHHDHERFSLVRVTVQVDWQWDIHEFLG